MAVNIVYYASTFCKAKCRFIAFLPTLMRPLPYCAATPANSFRRLVATTVCHLCAPLAPSYGPKTSQPLPHSTSTSQYAQPKTIYRHSVKTSKRYPLCREVSSPCCPVHAPWHTIGCLSACALRSPKRYVPIIPGAISALTLKRYAANTLNGFSC